MKDEGAVDEQMSDGPADIPMSEPGAQAEQPLDSHPSVEPLLTTKVSGYLTSRSVLELKTTVNFAWYPD